MAGSLDDDARTKILAGFTEDALKRAPSRAEIYGFILDAVDVLSEQIAEQGKRVAQVEQKGLTYRGVWQRAGDYERGAIVTDKGSAWAAVKAVNNGERPGEGSAWQMMLKSS